MKIGNKEFKEILIWDGENNLVASITDDNIINDRQYKVLCKPVDQVKYKCEMPKVFGGVPKKQGYMLCLL